MSMAERSHTAAFTEYHSAYYAHELTKRSPSGDVRKLGRSLFNATVDLNPHQLDAALFAFQSPLSRGAILADEVGLGKTIEAGLIISQLWAEHKRRILVIAPTTLRKQWAQELKDKFFIDSVVLDSRVHAAGLKTGARPWEQRDRVVICSYHFAWAKALEIKTTPWHLVVIDEAHRLRNVYKSGNKIATELRDAVGEMPKILLTATPLQNNLLELFGLVSFIDGHLFGSIEAFRARYMRGPIEERQFRDLKQRLAPVCQRTLRRQVQEYVRFTNRIPITQDFTPTPQEQDVYERVSEYLRREKLVALPNSQRKLITIILRKLLASSTFAIAQTLDRLVVRVQENRPDVVQELAEDYETADDEREEWGDEVPDEEAPPDSEDELNRRAELNELLESSTIAGAITQNAKGEALLTALNKGFEKLRELGAAEKAVIFTESKRTQQYLIELLNGNGYPGRVLTINGTNTDDRSGAIYREWVERHQGEQVVSGNKPVDLRAALVEHFRDHADILIATEAAAEGVNLQFCSLVVNYDLPWNPQRVEQRIGRCHRYGQKHDVVVINFLNRSNEADLRVFQLLSDKFRLFDGIFGSSDEVLGALESGVDFERRIGEIYQTCRTAGEIDAAFNDLQIELEEQIAARMADTRAKLLENFDEEVRRRLRGRLIEAEAELDNLQTLLWSITMAELGHLATFHDATKEFDLKALPPKVSGVPLGRYQFVSSSKGDSVAEVYRTGHPLAVRLVELAKSRRLPAAQVTFDYTNSHVRTGRIGLVEDLVGRSGWLLLTALTVDALEAEDRLLFAVADDDGTKLHSDVGAKLLQVLGVVDTDQQLSECPKQLAETAELLKHEAIGEIGERNNAYFDQELEKLDRWADDLKHGLEANLKDLDYQIKVAQREAKTAGALADKLESLKKVKELESERSKKRRELFDAHDEIEERKGGLISEVESRLQQKISAVSVFTLRWRVI